MVIAAVMVVILAVAKGVHSDVMVYVFLSIHLDQSHEAFANGWYIHLPRMACSCVLAVTV